MSQVRGFRTTHIHSTRSVNIRILGRRREWMTLGVVKRLTSLEGSIPSSSAKRSTFGRSNNYTK